MRQTEIVLKGVVRAERLPDPTEFVGDILTRVKREYIVRTYGIKDWEVRHRHTPAIRLENIETGPLRQSSSSRTFAVHEMWENRVGSEDGLCLL